MPETTIATPTPATTFTPADAAIIGPLFFRDPAAFCQAMSELIESAVEACPTMPDMHMTRAGLLSAMGNADKAGALPAMLSACWPHTNAGMAAAL